jgi:hypothetical protein
MKASVSSSGPDALASDDNQVRGLAVLLFDEGSSLRRLAPTAARHRVGRI